MEIAVELEGTPRIPPAHSILPNFRRLLCRPRSQLWKILAL